MKATINIREILEEKLGETPTIPATIDIGEVIQFMDADEDYELDVHELLAERQAIALIWDADQILSHYPHLTRAQAWEVLQECERNYKGEEGLCWDDIAEVITELFPEPAEKLYRVQVAVKTVECYEVHAASEDEATERWGEGRLCGTDDNQDSKILCVEEVLP